MGKVELPANVTRLLWDTDERSVSWETHRDSLIGRILAHGDWEAVRWLRREAGDEEIRAWIIATRARRLSRPQVRFWQVLLEMPDALVNSCLCAPERQVWDQRCG